MRWLWLLCLLGCGTARAVVVRGVVSGPLGQPVPGARVQLILLGGGTRSVADTVSGVDGTYEIRSDRAGRFVLLTASVRYAPQLSREFYGGRTDVLTQTIVLDPRAIAPRQSDAGFGLTLPLAQLGDAPEQLSALDLLTRAQLDAAFALVAQSFLLEGGQTGQRGSLLVRGGGAEALGVTLDGVNLSPLGGPEQRRYALGRLSTTGLASADDAPAAEVLAGPNPDAPLSSAAGSLVLHTAEATNSRAALEYAGDAGNLHTWRDALRASLTRQRADLLLEASRFDTSNALPNDRFHEGVLAADAGYHVSGNTAVRLIARQSASAGALPIPYDLGLTPTTRDALQETALAANVSTQTTRGWQNEAGYALLRSREQLFTYSNAAGRVVTLYAADGTAVEGQAAPFPLAPRQDWATLRDTGHYATSYPFRPWLTGRLRLLAESERALINTASERVTVDRTNLGAAASFVARFRHRVSLQAAGEITHSSSFGLTGTPRVGLTWAPVLPTGSRRFRGTVLHATLATGNTEPGLAAQAQGTAVLGRSRMFNFGVDQNLFREKLVVHAGYFHEQFSHQVEALTLLSTLPGEPGLGDALAYRTQGAALDLRYQPRTRLVIRATYTYLASLVEQSAEPVSINPALPGSRIGALSALVGARPFARPPHTGSAEAQYTGRIFSAAVTASLASGSDGTTGLAQTPTLLLPNHNLNPAFARVDSRLALAISRRTAFYLQGENLLNQQHLGTFGYPATPLTVRAGLRFRLGGD